MLYTYSMLSSMTTTLILGMLFIFLSNQSKKVYMGLWGSCWVLYSFVFLLDFINLLYDGKLELYLAIRQSFLLVISWLFFWGTYRFFQIKIPRFALPGFLFSLLISLISIPIISLYSITLIPIIIITSSLLIGSGCMFISYSWTQTLQEKLFASFLIILWAFFINHFGFTISHVRIAFYTYSVGIAIVTVLMLILMIIHFKKSHFLDNKQTKRFRLLVENTSNQIFLFNYRKRTFEYISPDINKLIGVSNDQLYTYPERFFDHMEISDKNRKIFSLFKTPVSHPGNVLLSLIRRGEIVNWIEMHYVPIADDMGNITSIEGILRDVTSERKAHEKVLETEVAKNEFIENITHEIRTPITLIRGYSECLINDIIPKKSQDIYLQMILSKSLLLNALLDDLKQVANFTSQDLEYKFYETSAYKYFNDAIEHCKYQITQSNHDFSYDINIEDDIIMIIDPHRITQVITNLVNNAIRHTPSNSTIYIYSGMEPVADDVPLNDNLNNTLPDGMVFFKVKDTGDGLAESDIPHVFERGFSCKNKTTNNEKNSHGLGLYISNQIINHHSGQIFAENNINKGATFTFYLPYYK